MIRESERPLQKELPRPAKGSKDGKQGKQESRRGYGTARLKDATMPKGNRKRVYWRVKDEKAEFYSA